MVNSGKKHLGLLEDRAFVAILIILILTPGFVACAWYYYNLQEISDAGDFSEQRYSSGYGYYSPQEFLGGSGYFDLVYYIDNESWVFPDNINDAIHFNVSEPETGTFVEGDYTPDFSIINDTLYLDILVVNWNDTAHKGSCYQISDSSSAYLYYNDTGYDWESYHRSLELLSVSEYNKSIGTREYDEIRIGLPIFGSFVTPVKITDYPDYIDWEYILFERNRNGSVCPVKVPVQTAIACNIEVVR